MLEVGVQGVGALEDLEHDLNENGTFGIVDSDGRLGREEGLVCHLDESFNG